jgi:hypothetical protein
MRPPLVANSRCLTHASKTSSGLLTERASKRCRLSQNKRPIQRALLRQASRAMFSSWPVDNEFPKRLAVGPLVGLDLGQCMDSLINESPSSFDDEGFHSS